LVGFDGSLGESESFGLEGDLTVGSSSPSKGLSDGESSSPPGKGSDFSGSQKRKTKDSNETHVSR
jgi:hypothetical protein